MTLTGNQKKSLRLKISRSSSVKKVLPLNHQYSVASGVFSGLDETISMRLNQYGRYEYQSVDVLSEKRLENLNRLDLMSDLSDNEDVLGRTLFGNVKGIRHNKTLGYYTDLYAGYVNEGTYREKGTSGGFGTWLLCELLKTNEIDGVIHVHAVEPEKSDGVLFKYHISRTEGDVRKGAKARYYPMELSKVLLEVKKVPGRYAIVGISDFITEIRLLCEADPVFKERIVFTIGLFNAHQKSTKYAEALAWHVGIKPGDLESIDFRVKNPHNMAWNYQCSMEGRIGAEKVSVTKDMTEFPIHPWNLGFFKSKFSDFTDNAFNELADITLGDAWLHEYAQDYRGTNILVVRNPTISNIIKRALDEGRIILDELSEETIISSQGMLTHLIDELPYRLYRNRSTAPKKRTEPSLDIPYLRRRVQDLRARVLSKNDAVYLEAVRSGDYEMYRRFVDKHLALNEGIYKLIDIKRKGVWSIVAEKAAPIKSKASAIVRRVNAPTRIRRVGALLRNRRFDGAIVSLNDDFNYGNILQRFALQTFLKQHDLHYVQLAVYTHYLASVRDKNLKNSLAEFSQEYIETVPFDPTESSGYKSYIVGSDQVWRNHWSEDIEHDYLPYWLHFVGRRVKSKRVSYAASFGVNNLYDARIIDDVLYSVKPLLDKFDAISVREGDGLRLVDEIAGRSVGARVVVDPTLLLASKDYSSLIDDSSYKDVEIGGVFSYILDLATSKTRIIENVASRLKTDATIFTADATKQLEPMELWLKGFRDAQFAVTDSFHGAVFSIINETDFVILANGDRGLSRVENLLDIVGISRDRLVFPEEVGKKFDASKLKPIDWTVVTKRIGDLRKDSGNWLLSNLK